MNKKLFALVMVPVLVVMGGALAFSAFSGDVTTNVTATAGHISVNEYATLYSGYSKYTSVKVTGGFGSNTNTAYLNDSKVYPVNKETNLATVPSESSGAQNVVYWVNVSQLSPGDWVQINLVLEDKGPLGIEFADPVISTTGLNALTLTGVNVNLSNVTGSLNSDDVFTANPLSGISGLSAAGDYLAATTEGGLSTGISSPAETGYAYALGSLFSNFNIPLGNGGSATYSFYIGLSTDAGNNYAGSSISIPIVVSVSSVS